MRVGDEDGVGDRDGRSAMPARRVVGVGDVVDLPGEVRSGLLDADDVGVGFRENELGLDRSVSGRVEIHEVDDGDGVAVAVGVHSPRGHLGLPRRGAFYEEEAGINRGVVHHGDEVVSDFVRDGPLPGALREIAVASPVVLAQAERIVLEPDVVVFRGRGREDAEHGDEPRDGEKPFAFHPRPPPTGGRRLVPDSFQHHEAHGRLVALVRGVLLAVDLPPLGAVEFGEFHGAAVAFVHFGQHQGRAAGARLAVDFAAADDVLFVLPAEGADRGNHRGGFGAH